MRKIGRIVWVLAAVLALSGTAAFAQQGLELSGGGNEWRPQVDFTLDWSSRYIDLGEVLNPDPVGQADLCLSLKGFYVGVWTCVDFTDVWLSQRSEEWNYYVGYEYKFTDVPAVGATIDLA